MSNYITAYKAVRLDMTSHYDRKTPWEPGVPVRVENPDSPTENGCGRGIHVSRTLLGTIRHQFSPSEYLTVEVDSRHIIQETEKLRVSECLPVRVLSAEEQDALAGFRLWEANHPVNPLLVEGAELPDEDLRRLLADWASVRGSDLVWASVRGSDLVWDLVWGSVGASVWDLARDLVRDLVRDLAFTSVRDSAWAYACSLFPNVTSWRGTDREHPWDSLRALWLAGYVPSLDGTTWRLHRGPEAKVVLSVPATLQ